MYNNPNLSKIKGTNMAYKKLMKVPGRDKRLFLFSSTFGTSGPAYV